MQCLLAKDKTHPFFSDGQGSLIARWTKWETDSCPDLLQIREISCA
jgi:hypothetical protein